MTVPAETPFNIYTANGATTVFAYTFRVENESELKVYVDEIEQTSGFTVTGVGDNGGGSVTFSIAPASASIVHVLREMPTTRTIDYQNSGDFKAGTVNEDIDRVWLKMQEIERELNYRTLQFAETNTSRTPSINALPAAAIGQVLSWQIDGSLANSTVQSLASEVNISSTIDRYETVAALVAAQPSSELVWVSSQTPGWVDTVNGPSGGHFAHKTGATNLSPTVGSPVAVSSVGSGAQLGYYWDAAGEEWKISDTQGLFLQSLTGAVHRTVVSRLRDRVYLRDFGGFDGAALTLALASGAKVIDLGSTGTLALSATYTIPAGVELTSSGATIQTSGNTTIFNLSQASKMTRVTAVGAGIASGDTSEIFARISGVGLCEVTNCNISQMGGTAILVRQYYTDHDGSRITDNDIHYNNIGIDLEERGEYCTVGQNCVNNNAYGIIFQGGNNRVVNNTITDNTIIGLHLTAGTNDAHGVVDSNSINHNAINIQIEAINVEECSFTGNNIYVGKIVLNGCFGVTFVGGIIESSVLIEEKGAQECVFRAVKFPGGINNTPNDGSPSKVLYKDSDIDRSISSGSADSINGAYSEVRRSSITTLATSSTTTQVFNAQVFNAITKNASFTVEQLYDVGTYTWDPTAAIVERGYVVDVSLQFSVSRTGADVDTANVHVLVVNAANNSIIYGVATPSPQNILSGDVRTHTYSFSGPIPRAAFQVQLINNSANTITLMSDQTNARSKCIVTEW